MWGTRGRRNILSIVTRNFKSFTSNNIVKIWKALHMHFVKHPQDKGRYPLFTTGFQGDPPVLACGSTGPLGGERMFAEYFHGRCAETFSIHSSD